MTEIVAADPFRCRMWQGHERLEEWLSEETCSAEIDSFLSHGQRLPVLGRRLKDEETHDFELVYGARRLFVARHLKVPLSVDVRELTDREAIVALDIENRQRQDLSPYERGRSYSLWLKRGLFCSQDALARTLNISPSQVSRLVSLAELPAVIVGAFPSPLEICETWGRDLLELWKDPCKRRALTAAAEAVRREPVQRPAAGVVKRLLSAANERSIRTARSPSYRCDQVVKDTQGSPLFRVRQQRTDIALLLPVGTVSTTVLSEITREIARILQRARTQAPDLPRQRIARVVAPDRMVTSG